MNEQVVLGIDIGGTNTVYGLVTKDGSVIYHESCLLYTSDAADE